jgi:hypothetical protein
MDKIIFEISIESSHIDYSGDAARFAIDGAEAGSGNSWPE